MTTHEEIEEFDSGWQKGVWDFAIITTQLNDSTYIMTGPIDYRYGLNYGILTMERFNSCGGYVHYATHNDRNIVHSDPYTKEGTKRIDVGVQYYWYHNGESWHFTNDFYPHSIEFYKYKTNPNTNTNPPQPVPKPKEIYELALLMDSNRKYRKILSGPVLYETQLHNICFNETQPYIKGDIHVLRKYGFCAKKVDANKFFSIFNENPQYGIEFNFDLFNKVELWQLHYDKKEKWERYKDEQKEEKYDLVLVTDRQKVIQYILHNVIIDCVDEIIKFTSFEAYASGDRNRLEQLAIKIKGFGIEPYKLWLDNEDKTNFIVDSLYETMRHKQFVFPNGMTPFKAFFYRFESAQSHYEWKQYKNPTEPPHMALRKKYFRMDSNRQLIYNNPLSPIPKEEDAIHTNEHKVSEYSETRESVMDDMSHVASTDMCVTTVSATTPSSAPKYDIEEMIVNYSCTTDYDGWVLSPKNVQNVQNAPVHSESGSSNKETVASPLIHKTKMAWHPLWMAKHRTTEKGNDDALDVWSLYFQKYGFEPKNATQLMRFSQHCKEVVTLKYVEARKQFNKHKNKIR